MNQTNQSVTITLTFVDVDVKRYMLATFLVMSGRSHPTSTLGGLVFLAPRNHMRWGFRTFGLSLLCLMLDYHNHSQGSVTCIAKTPLQNTEIF